MEFTIDALTRKRTESATTANTESPDVYRVLRSSSVQSVDWGTLPDVASSIGTALSSSYDRVARVRAPSSTDSIADDIDSKTKGVTRMFLLFWHASNCDGLPPVASATPCRCSSWAALSGGNRENVREFLSHMNMCKQKRCAVLHCTLTRSYLEHSRSCADLNCQGCQRLRSAQGRIPPKKEGGPETEDIANVLAMMRSSSV